jgi:hypothetical protein
MAAIAVLKVEHGWAGDRKRNRLIVTAAATDSDTLAPAAAGLQEIEAIVPTGRAGTIDGNTVVAASCVDYNIGTDVIVIYTPEGAATQVSSGNYEFYVYGK